MAVKGPLPIVVPRELGVKSLAQGPQDMSRKGLNQPSSEHRHRGLAHLNVLNHCFIIGWLRVLVKTLGLHGSGSLTLP